MKTELKISYCLKKNTKKPQETNAVIYCTLSEKRKRTLISTGIKIPINTWIVDFESVQYTESTKDAYKELEKFKKSVDDCIFLMRENGDTIDTISVKKQLSKSEKMLTFFDLSETFISYYRALQAKNKVTIASIDKHKQNIKKFKAFLESENKSKKGLSFFGKKDANLFVEYLEKYTPLSQNTRRKTLQGIKNIFEYACKMEMITKNPFDYCDIPTYIQKEIIFLTEKEIKILENATFLSEALTHVKDLFLFQCFTGLAYIDLANAINGIHQLEEQPDNENFRFWIKGERQKSGVFFRVPLLPQALDIIQKYKGLQNLPLMTNQKYNFYLKEVSHFLGFKKELTTHIGRKTFGFYALNKGASYEVVASVLGHKSISTTQSIYAKVLDKRITEEMEKVKTKGKSPLILHINQTEKQTFSKFTQK